jgi:predicted transcriptional regulator
VPRKSQKTLAQGREDIRRRYVRGNRINHAIRGDTALTDLEREINMEVACVLTAAGFSHNYIADALSVTKDTVSGWFKNEQHKESMARRVAQVKAEILSGAVDLLRASAIEIVESLLTMARTTEDEALAARILMDLLDRIGISKVNKSESISAQTIKQTQEVDITDTHGIVEVLGHLDTDQQEQIATHLEAAMAIVSEHTDKDVTK